MEVGRGGSVKEAPRAGAVGRAATVGLVLIAAVMALAPAPARRGSSEGTPMRTATRDRIVLPQPQLQGRMTLEEALAARRSVREFRKRPLELHELSQLLWAAQGVTGRGGLRSAPSAGALYPLEVYVALPTGSYHYEPAHHRLEPCSDEDIRPALHRAAGQALVLEAPAVFVITGVEARTALRYSGRAARYVQLEAGHAAQNLLLEATALGLGGVPVGAFDDVGVHRAMRLAAGEEALYLIPVGQPR